MNKEITIKLSGIQPLILITALNEFAYRIQEAEKEDTGPAPILSYGYVFSEIASVEEQLKKYLTHEENKDT